MALAAIQPAAVDIPLTDELERLFVLVDRRRDAASLVLPAGHASVTAVATMVRHGSGFLCVALPDDLADHLGLPPMVRGGRRLLGGVPGVTVDAAMGISTGISAADRALTLRVLADPRTTRDELSRPGHVVPIRVARAKRSNRVSPAHAAVTLATRLDFPPVAALTELVSEADPRRMADGGEAHAFAARLGLEVFPA